MGTASAGKTGQDGPPQPQLIGLKSAGYKSLTQYQRFTVVFELARRIFATDESTPPGDRRSNRRVQRPIEKHAFRSLEHRCRRSPGGLETFRFPVAFVPDPRIRTTSTTRRSLDRVL